jgi:transcriptional regulator with PAS, ATPase and Fis domain
VLQEREVRPIGTTASQPVDVRLVAATNRDLRRDIADGRFRLDLLYRLRVFPIVVPPLRERPEDVAGLAEHFLAAIEREEGRKTGGFEPATLTVLARYAWPGNVRELQNEVHRLVLCAEPDETLAPDMLAPWILEEVPASAMTDTPLRDLIRQVEAAIIQSRLREHGYRRAATARSLGITREALWAKLRQLGIVPPGPRTQ